MENQEDNLLTSHRKWFLLFFPLAWSGHTGLGLALGVFGPTQPYIAKNVGTSVDNINFIWTGRSIGFCITAVVAALLFRKYLKTRSQKLCFLAFAEIVTGIFVMITPFVYNFPLLIAMVSIYGMGLGLFDTADNSLIVYMLGPNKSRPFTQSLHAFVGVGFIIGSFLVQPFLPSESGENKTVCPGSINTNNATVQEEYNPKLMGGISSINWPFILIGVWLILTAAGNIILAFSGIEMPRYYSDETEDKNPEVKTFTNVRFWKMLLVMIYCYYVFSCGLEGFFQSMTYTYGLCGPLEMTTQEAAMLNSLYFGAFVFGRSSGILISKYIEPTKLILGSLSGCIGSALLLSIFASYSKIGLYIGTFLMGYSVSFQFASGISWTAGLFNVTGKASFIFFLGGYTGFLSIPPIAGTIFTADESKVGFFYLALGITISQMILFIAMMIISRFKKSN